MWARFFSLLLASSLAHSQQIVTIAGLAPDRRQILDGVQALDAPLGATYAVIRDRITGRLLIHDQSLVERIEPDGTLLAFAGNGRTNGAEGDVADGTPASNLRISILRGMTQDATGNLYLSDAGAGRVFRVALDGTVTTFAGGNPAISVPMSSPRGLAFDSQGNLYIAEVGCQCIRRIDTAGIATTLYVLPPTQPFLYFEGLAIDSADNLYAAVYSGHRILKITPDGTATTIAGTGTNGFSGDGDPATFAQLRFPSDLTIAADGTIYIADTGNNRIRRIRPDGTIETIAGTGVLGFAGDGGPAITANLAAPAQLLLDPDGTLYFGDYANSRIRRITPDGAIATIAGNGKFVINGLLGDGGPAIYAGLNYPAATVFDTFGNLYIADSNNRLVRKITPDGLITTVAGHTGTQPFVGDGDGGPATKASLGSVLGLAIDSHNNLYISSEDGRVRKVDSTGTISLVAGNGQGSGPIRYQGDGGPAVNATLNEPKGMAVDAAGNVYIADTSNARLRMVDGNGVIHLVAAADTSLLGQEYWNAVTFDSQGRPLVAITRALQGGYWSTISRVNPDGSLASVAGNRQGCAINPYLDFTYDGQQATSVPLCSVTGMTFDAQGNLYFPDSQYGAILKMTPDGAIFRIAGTSRGVLLGDGGPAMNVDLAPPNLVIDAAGNLLFPEQSLGRIREITRTPVTLRLSRDRLDLQGGQTQTFGVTTNFAEPFPFMVRLQGAWLTANRTSGQTGETVQISTNTRGLASGSYHGTVTVTLILPGSQQQVDLPVTLTVP
jgi:NHL repeat